jgi:GDPmannose 4,6-dehydratase
LYAVSGISFNHESPRRPESFVTRKISRGIASIIRKETDVIRLGNIDAVRDWGYAPEFVEGMWRSLQPDEPGDYVFASGVGHTVREFVEFAFEVAGLDWRKHVEHDESFYRPHDVRATIGDPQKARDVLSWETTCLAPELARIMVESDLARGHGKYPLLDTPELATWR